MCSKAEYIIPVTNIYVLDQNNQLNLQQVISCYSINAIVFCKYFEAAIPWKESMWITIHNVEQVKSNREFGFN